MAQCKMYYTVNSYCAVVDAFERTGWSFTFTFSHLADAFIQSDLHMCYSQCIHILHLHCYGLTSCTSSGPKRTKDKVGATVVQGVEKSFSNQKVASSIPCRSVLEQDTEPPNCSDVQCAISVNVK